MAGVLDGVRVLDLSRVLAGPWAAQILADLGADVIKVERPGAGDDTRSWGPPYLKDTSGAPTSDAAYFFAANRGKRSLAVDIATPEGQRIVAALAQQTDILIENYKTGGLARYGLDYSSLRLANPKLVYCSITGFGQTGPNKHKPGYDFMIQGLAGLMSVTGTPETGPLRAGIAAADITTGLYATIGMLGALLHARATGQGQQLDLALFDVQVGWLANQASNYLIGGVLPGLQGNTHPNLVPYRDFPTADGRIIIAVGNDRQFATLAGVLDRAAWAADPRFAVNAARIANRDVLEALIADLTRQRSSADLIAALEAAGVPCGKINQIDQVFAEPQVVARDLVVSVEHPVGGTIRTVAHPVKYSESPPRYDRAPPLLGEHSHEILRELNYTAEDIAALEAAAVIAG
jgi:crotonobetainyl-CoA:carnitine CoA-transferase CaiB-like acyl-CoA transferase